jgi:hypothetical protein
MKNILLPFMTTDEVRKNNYYHLRNNLLFPYNHLSYLRTIP